MYTESSVNFLRQRNPHEAPWQKAKLANGVLTELPNTSDREVRKELADLVIEFDCRQVMSRNVYQVHNVA